MNDYVAVWQASLLFGPCTEEEAQAVVDEIVLRVGFPYGASHSLERLDDADGEDA